MSVSTSDISIDINQFKLREKQLAAIANGTHHTYHTSSHHSTSNAAVATTTTSNNTTNIPHNYDIKVQVYYCGLILVIYIRDTLKLDELLGTIRSICKFDQQQLFTVKWVDEEGDPCTLSSQLELNEALRLYHVNKESELIVHVFANIPERPGTQCAGEDRSIYRRGARRWRKIYLVNDHKYQAKRFAPTALCKVCQDRIWGLGRQGYKCLECKIMVHKRCHKFISLRCGDVLAQQQQLTALNSLGSAVASAVADVTSSPLANGHSRPGSSLIEDLKLAQKHKQALRAQQSAAIQTNSSNSGHHQMNGKQPLATQNENRKGKII